MVQQILTSPLRVSPEKKQRQNLIHNLWKRLTSPKTNYTYSISPSYSHESLADIFDEENYSIPIMSRPNLRHRTGEELVGHSKKMTSLKDDIGDQSLPTSIHSTRRVYLEEQNLVTRSSFYGTPKHYYQENQSRSKMLGGNQSKSRNISNLYGLDFSDEERNVNPNLQHARSQPNYFYLFINCLVAFIRSIIQITLIKIYSFKNALLSAVFKIYQFVHHMYPFKKNYFPRNSSGSTHFINEQETEGEDEISSRKNYGRGTRRSARINKSSLHDVDEISRNDITRPRHQHYDRDTHRRQENETNVGLSHFVHSKASNLKNGAFNLIHQTGHKALDTLQNIFGSRQHREYNTRSQGDTYDGQTRGHPQNTYARRHGQRHTLFPLCSLPCLLLLLLPLLLALYLKRGPVDDYMKHNQRINDYYQPLKTRFNALNEKVLDKVPEVKNMTSTKLHALVSWLTNLTSFRGAGGKWSPDSDIRMVLEEAKHLFSQDNDQSGEKSEKSSHVPLLNAFKSAYGALKADYDALKSRISHLEILKDKKKPYDPDWWKSSKDSPQDLKLLIENVVGKDITELKDKLNSVNAKLISSPPGGTDSQSSSSLALLKGELAQLTTLLNGLQRKYDALSTKTEVQERELETAKMSLGRIQNDKSLQTLLTRTDTLNVQVEAIHKAIEKSRLDTEKLSQFAKECCKRDVVYNKEGTLGESDIANLLLKLKVSDMDAQTKDKFYGLLQQHFASHSKLDELKSALHINITKMGKDLNELKHFLVREIKEKIPFQSSVSPGDGAGGGDKGSCLEEQRVRKIIEEMLDLYSADQTGMPDYALESGGGTVVNTRCSETYDAHAALIKLWGIPLWYKANSPRIAIQPGTQPGQCWAFKGPVGYLVIKLAATIKPTAFTIDHIPKTLSPSGTIDSAPKDFSVWALQDENDVSGTMLGRYRFDKDGKPLQLFISQKPDPGYVRYVELKIESNWGNPEYTCLYRFRVHGTLQDHQERH